MGREGGQRLVDAGLSALLDVTAVSLDELFCGLFGLAGVHSFGLFWWLFLGAESSREESRGASLAIGGAECCDCEGVNRANVNTCSEDDGTCARGPL